VIWHSATDLRGLLPFTEGTVRVKLWGPGTVGGCQGRYPMATMVNTYTDRHRPTEYRQLSDRNITSSASWPKHTARRSQARVIRIHSIDGSTCICFQFTLTGMIRVVLRVYTSRLLGFDFLPSRVVVAFPVPFPFLNTGHFSPISVKIPFRRIKLPASFVIVGLIESLNDSTKSHNHSLHDMHKMHTTRRRYIGKENKLHAGV